MADYRENLSWALQLEGDFNASLDKSAAALRDMSKASDAARAEMKLLREQMQGLERDSDAYRAAEAKVKALSHAIDDNTAKTKALREEQQAAAEQAKVAERNLLGTAAAVGVVVTGLTTAVAAYERWIESLDESNKRLQEAGVYTGDAGRAVDKLTASTKNLGLAWDKLSVDLGSGPVQQLTKLSDALSGVFKIMDDNKGLIDWLDIRLKAALVGLTGGGALIAYAGAAVDNLVIDKLAQQGQVPVAPPVAAGMGDVKGVESTEPGSQLYGRSGAFQDVVGPATAALGLSGRDPVKPKYDYKKVVTAIPALSGRDFEGIWGMDVPLPADIGNLAGTTIHDTTGGAGLDIAYQQMAEQVFGPQKAKHPINGMALAGGLASGSLASTLGAINPIAGMVAGVAPHLGSTFDGLIGQATKLPDQLVSGIEHILAKLPDVLGKTIPDLVVGIVSAIPELIDALVMALPGVIKAGLVDLPVALARAIGEALGIGGSPREREQKQTAIRNSRNLAVNPHAYFTGKPGQGGRIPTSREAQRMARALQQVVGSYGLGDDLSPLVT